MWRARAVNGMVSAIERYWFAPAPAARLAAVRILVGGFALIYLTLRALHIWSYTDFGHSQFAPIGVLFWMGSPPPGWAVAAVLLLGWASGLAFVCGWRFRLTGPVFAAVLLLVLTYSSSWRQIFHTENALVVYVAILAVTCSADAYSIDRMRLGAPTADPHWRYGWPLRLMSVVIVATYFLAGVAKLRWGGPGWAGGDVLRDTIAADSLRKIVLGSTHSPIAELALPYGWLFNGLALLTLVVEVGAPLALIHRRIAALWVAGVIGFHLGVLALMAILFPFPISGVAFAPMFRAERFIEGVRARWRRLRKRRASG